MDIGYCRVAFATQNMKDLSCKLIYPNVLCYIVQSATRIQKFHVSNSNGCLLLPIQSELVQKLISEPFLVSFVCNT